MTLSRVATLSTVLVLMAGFTGCNSSITTPAPIPQGHAADEAKIRQLDADWVKAAATHNADAWTAFYADDAVVLPPNEKVAITKAAIHSSMAAFLALPELNVTWTPTQVVVAGSGDLAYLYGAYKMTAKDPSGKPIVDTGKNVEIWRKQPNGEWKGVVDTWNSDLPLA